MGKSRRVPGHVLPHLPHGHVFALFFGHHPGVPLDHLPDFLPGRAGQKLSGLQVMDGPGEEPGIAFGAAPDHHPVAARLVDHPLRILGGKDISVSPYRNGYGLFYLPDDVPVRLSLIELGPGSAVDRHGRHAGILRHLRKLHGIYGVQVKALAEFHRHRFVKLLHHGAEDPMGQLRVLHESGPLVVIDHLGHGASHIHVDHGKGPLLQPEGHIRHDVRVRTEDLDRQGRILFTGCKELIRVFTAVKKRLGAHHLGACQGTSLFPAEKPVRQIRDAGHGGQRHVMFQCYVSDC